MSFGIDNLELYRSNLHVDSVGVEDIGKYFCVFNDSISSDSTDSELVIKSKATSLYIYVNGEFDFEVESCELNDLTISSQILKLC